MNSQETTENTRYEREMLAAEKVIVEKALVEFKCNKTATAVALGVDRKTLYNIIKRTGIELAVSVNTEPGIPS